MTYAQQNPFELWDLRKSLGIQRDVLPAYTFWTDMFTRQVNSTDEYIDFEKLPRGNRRLAQFTLPASPGKPVYTDRSTGYRFKPAYVKVKDAVDPSRVLSKIPGIDPMLSMTPLTPMQRREMLKVNMAIQAVQTIQRRWEWMCAKACIDGKVTLSGPDYPTTIVDFLRASNQTVTLTAGNRWGDSGVSILTFLQNAADTMIYPAQNSDGTGGFGGFPDKLIVGSNAWAAMRVDPEIKDLMNKFYPATGTEINRGFRLSEKVVQVGKLGFGGTGGVSVDVILYRDSYVDDSGTEQLLLQPNQMVLMSSAEALQGHRCFGAIVDPFAQYQSLEIFARNYMENGDPAVEYLLHQSAPLMVPVNPNASFMATVTA